MEELGVVDCPPTPEILPVSSTPPARHEITYSSSSEDLDESADGRRSPPPKCAICLGKCRQPSYTNSCSHRFCFQCLWEWSKVKPECPLCKQSFIEIAYRHRVDSQPFITPVPRPIDEQRHEIYQQQLNFLLTDRGPHRFLYSTSLRVRPSQSELLQELFMHQSNDVQRFVREFGNQPIPSRLNTIEWRRFIYVQRLFARPLPDINGCFRDTSASYYQNNSTQLNRILPWADRELFAINVPRSGIHVITMMQETDVESQSFLDGLNHILPLQYRAHFQHELVNFARSPYDMIGYDRCVQYDPPFSVRLSLPTSPRNVVISSSEPDDDEIVYLPSSPGPAPASAGSSSNNNSNHSTSHSNTGSQGSASSRRVGRTQFHIEARSSVQTVIMTGTLRESGASAGVSDGAVPLATTGTQTPHVIEVNDDAPAPSAQPAPTLMQRPGTSTLRDGDNIELSSSDSDECQFVREQKPPHLRTPDHVVDLESASDSDVVFVDEAGAIPAPKVSSAEGGAAAAAASQTSQQDALKKETSTGCLEYNQGASTSSGYCGGMSGGSGASGSGPTGGLRPRHYAMPSLNRYAGGIGMKSIYEASDTDDDSDGVGILGSAYKGSSESSSASSSHEEFLFRSVQQQSARGRKRKRLVKRVAPPPKPRGKKEMRDRPKDVSSDSSIASGSSASSSSSRSSSSSSSSSSTDSSSSRSSSSSSTNSSSTSSTSTSSSTSTNSSHLSEAVKPAKRRKRQTSSNPKATARGARSKKTRKSKQPTGSSTKLPKDGATDVGVKPNRRNRSQQSPRTQSVASSSKSSTKASSKGTKRRKTKAKTSDTRARGGKRTKRGAKMEAEVHPASPAVEAQRRAVRDHYFVETRPSCSPTEEAGNKTRRLKSVIIKRCHYNRKPNTASATTTTMTTTTTTTLGVEAEPTQRTSSTLPVDVKISIRIPATVEATLNQEPSTSGLPLPVAQPVDDSNDRRQETAATLLQLSSPASDSGSETTELDEHVWDILKLPLDIVPSASEPERDQMMPAVQEQHSAGGPEETLQTQQSNEDDHQQPFPLDGGGILMEEESNSIASESLFAPAVSWELGTGEATTLPDGASSSHEPPLATAITEDRLSSAAASPFSSVSFPPSTASLSTSPTLSLAVPTRPASPVELLDVVGTIDGESPLPSSVVDIGAIDGTIDDIMATEEVPVIEETPVASDALPDGCVLEAIPEASAGTETVGAEVEL